MNAALKTTLRMAALGLAVCAVLALCVLAAMAIDASTVSLFDGHLFSGDRMFYEEIAWAPVVFIVLTFAFFVASMAVLGVFAVVALVLTIVALLLLSPVLVVVAVVWLFRNGFDGPNRSAT
jgi:uncharacterized membrane protein YfhO